MWPVTWAWLVGHSWLDFELGGSEVRKQRPRGPTDSCASVGPAGRCRLPPRAETPAGSPTARPHLSLSCVLSPSHLVRSVDPLLSLH